MQNQNQKLVNINFSAPQSFQNAIDAYATINQINRSKAVRQLIQIAMQQLQLQNLIKDSHVQPVGRPKKVHNK